MNANELTVGRLVRVEARTWPGINKQGGIGRIAQVHHNPDKEGNDEVQSVDVTYVLGGREKGIPVNYVCLAEQYEQPTSSSSLRDRSMLLGRCKTCGSLRRDCGSCDWRQEEELQRQQVKTTVETIQPAKVARRPSKRAKKQTIPEITSSSSSEESYILPISSWRQKKIISSTLSSSSDSSSSSDGYNAEQSESTSRRIRRNLALLNRFVRETAPRKRPVAKKEQPSSGQPARQRKQLRVAEVDQHDIGDADLSQETSPRAPPRHQRRSQQQSPSRAEVSPVVGKSSPIMLVDNDLDGFLQPEGEATNLPRDTMDKTRQLAFPDLPQFFQDTLQRVRDQLPKVRKEFQDLKVRIETCLGIKGSSDDLEQEGWQLHDEVQTNLLRDGLDQCRVLFRRLSSRKELRKHAASLTKAQLRQFSREANDHRDLLFDQLDGEVNDFLISLSNYLHDVGGKSPQDDGTCGDDDSGDEYIADQEDAGMPPFTDNDDELRLPDVEKLAPFDPHMHARVVRKRKKKGRRLLESMKSSKRSHPGRRTLHNLDEDPSGSDETGEKQMCTKRSRRNVAASVTTMMRKKQSRSCSSRAQRRVVGSIEDSEAYPEALAFSSTGADDIAPSAPDHPLQSRTAELPPQFIRTTKRSQSDDVSALDRMQAFLAANDLVENGDFSLDDMSRSHFSQTRRGRSSGGETQISQGTLTTTMTPIQYQYFDSILFESLRECDNNEVHVESGEDNACSKAVTPFQLIRSGCQLLSKDDDHLREIIERVEAGNVLSKDEVVSAFSFAHAYLVKWPSSLQELVVADQQRLTRTLKVLEALVMLIGHNLEKSLQPQDLLLHKLFSSTDQPCVFIQALCEQILDVLLAFFNPNAWALSQSMRQLNIVKLLTPLRDRLAEVVPLLELCSQFLLQRLGCQEWRLSSVSCSRRFVSCVDPALYKLFLETGEVARSSKGMSCCAQLITTKGAIILINVSKVRLKEFGSKIPRVEIHSIWSIMAFFAAAKVKEPALRSTYRWRLLYSIMCCETGTLPKTLDGGDSSSPSDEHLARCETELEYVTQLISRGDMDPLIESDKILSLLIKRAIVLHSRHCQFQDWTSHFCLESNMLEDSISMGLWGASDLLVSEAKLKEACSIYLASSNLAGATQKSIFLLESWVRRTKGKSVLLSQLASSVRTLMKEERQFQAGEDNRSFAVVFASRPSTDLGTLVRQSTAEVLHAFDMMRGELSFPSSTYVTSERVSKTWDQMSCEYMKHRHDLLLGARSEDSRPSNVPSLFACFSAIRMMSIFLFTHLGINRDQSSNDQGTEGTENQSHQYVLHRALACIMSSLECMCDLMMEAQADGSTNVTKLHALTTTFVWICLIVNRCRLILRLKDGDAQLATEVGSVGRSFLQLSGKAYHKCLRTVISFADDPNARNSLRICLSAIRSSIAWAAVISSRNQSTDVEDEFADIDDSAFMEIHIESMPRVSPLSCLFTSFKDILVLGEPSNLYAIQASPICDDALLRLHSRGRLLVSRLAGGIAVCLSAFSACLGEHCSLDDLILDRACKIGDSQDVTYWRNIVFILLSETCKLAQKYTPCKTTGLKYLPHSCHALLHGATDAESLERFPTCDIETMLRLTGAKGTRKEKRQLEMMRDNDVETRLIPMKKKEELDGPGAIYIANNLWSFRDCLAELSADEQNSSLYSLLMPSEKSPSSLLDHREEWASMEAECLKRMVFLQSFFSLRDISQMPEHIEEMLLTSMRNMALGVLNVAEGVIYLNHQQDTLSAKGGQYVSHKQGKLKILQTVCVESFVAIFATVVIRNWERLSENLRSSMSVIRNAFLFQINQQHFCLEGCFRQFSKLPQTPEQTKMDPLLDLRHCIRIACIRRCRYFIRHLSHHSDDKSGIVALLGNLSSLTVDTKLSCDVDVTMITEGFRIILVNKNYDWSNRPVVEEYIDQSLRLNQHDLTVSERRGIVELRRFLLTKLLPPRLRCPKSVAQFRSLVLHMMACLLGMEQVESGIAGLLGLDDLLEVLKALWTATKTLVSDGNEAESLSHLLHCVSRVLGMPFVDSLDKSTQVSLSSPLLCWAQRRIFRSDHIPSKDCIKKEDQFAFYVCTFGILMERIARALICVDLELETELATVMLNGFPSDQEENRILVAPDASVESRTLGRQLVSLSTWLEVREKENAAPNVENIYNKDQKASLEPGPLQLSRADVSPRAKRDLEFFLNVVKTLTGFRVDDEDIALE